MECEFCALNGTAGEAIAKCSECGEWVCEEHTQFRVNSAPLCPTCFEAASDEILEEDQLEDIEELD